MGGTDATRGDDKVILAAHPACRFDTGKSEDERPGTYMSSSSSGMTSIRFLPVSVDRAGNPQINTKVKTELRKEAGG